MALDMFMKIEGIPGESADERHPGEIEVLSFSWGESYAGVAPGGGAAGKAQVAAFHFSARSSQATPALFQACAAGKHFKEAVLSLRRPVGDPGQDFMTWRLQNVLVSAFRTGGDSSGPLPLDEVELSFERIEVRYRRYDATGRPGEEVQAGWDIKTNKSV